MRFQVFMAMVFGFCTGVCIPVLAEDQAPAPASASNPLSLIQSMEASKSYGMKTVVVEAAAPPTGQPILSASAHALADKANEPQTVTQPTRLDNVEAAFSKEKTPEPSEDKPTAKSDTDKEAAKDKDEPKVEAKNDADDGKVHKATAAESAAYKEIIFGATKPDALQKPKRLIDVH